MKRIMSMNEFVAAGQPAPAKPGVAPKVDPGTKPQTPSRPSPIRRSKPGTAPKPMAQAEDVVERYMKTLKSSKSPLNMDVKPIMKRYEGKQ